MSNEDIGIIFYLLKMCDDIEHYKTEYHNVEMMLHKRSGLNASLMNLSQIGEFSGRLSAKLKQRYPDIEWGKIKGLRNVIVHEYFGVDVEQIREIVENEIPQFIEQILEILEDFFKKGIIDKDFLTYSLQDFQVIDYRKRFKL